MGSFVFLFFLVEKIGGLAVIGRKNWEVLGFDCGEVGFARVLADGNLLGLGKRNKIWLRLQLKNEGSLSLRANVQWCLAGRSTYHVRTEIGLALGFSTSNQNLSSTWVLSNFVAKINWA